MRLLGYPYRSTISKKSMWKLKKDTNIFFKKNILPSIAEGKPKFI
jgi:hypothetical protein